MATGRANGIVVENYLLAQFNKSNGNKLQEVAFPKPLQVQYGAYAVQKGNSALVKTLNKFICGVQSNGQLGQDLPADRGRGTAADAALLAREETGRRPSPPGRITR